MMSPEEIIADFDRAVGLLIKHRERLRQPAENGAYLTDARIRLAQVVSLLRRFRKCECEYREKDAELSAESTPEKRAMLAGALRDLGADIKLYGEAFYYFAWRAKRSITHLEQLKAFNPIGVRTVRNDMIEHAEGARGMFVSYWMFDCPEGLVLKPIEGGIDRGLYPNAQEFIEKLLQKLEAIS